MTDPRLDDGFRILCPRRLAKDRGRVDARRLGPVNEQLPPRCGRYSFGSHEVPPIRNLLLKRRPEQWT